MSGCRHIVFTINNPTATHEELWSKISDFARYLVLSLEAGEKTGTPHYQGYIEFHKPKRYAWCSKNMAPGWYHKRDGSREEARSYCLKGESRLSGPWEHGEWLAEGQGRRSDLARVVELARAGSSYDQIARDQPEALIKYSRGIRELCRVFQPPRTGHVEVSVLYGPSGIGKSTWVEVNQPNSFWLDDGKWFDGYENNATIVLDEYRGQLPFRLLLRLLRPIGGCRVETKGGHISLVHTSVWITTNWLPVTWHDWEKKACKDGYQPLCNRIDHIYTLEKGELKELDKTLIL